MSEITVAELKERLEKNEELIIIDVREEWEHEEVNIENTRNIPLGTIPQHLEELSSLKEKEIILHCKSGNRSGQAQKYLISQGFKNTRNLVGGITAYMS
ncbi:rhodanese-like domain-containing protein [Xanthovirga aplysinae]|uniref:rhodanese-like domain-containing protein n=1 Tax=Xanthovirga aplysinae TaxID=2529853 RepID=UPI0012BC5E39|nr:rhodanese-like domain-containing protein [Xanthovirga aplysinae]MTI33453.1 rhodanese-like domain-containing protein [Xanthovirga aplysinae]